MADEPTIGIRGSDLLGLLDRIGTRLDAGFARMEAKMDGKADKADLLRIEARLDEHGREIGKLKDRQREDEAAQGALAQRHTTVIEWRKYVVATLAIALAALPGFLALWIH